MLGFRVQGLGICKLLGLGLRVSDVGSRYLQVLGFRPACKSTRRLAERGGGIEDNAVALIIRKRFSCIRYAVNQGEERDNITKYSDYCIIVPVIGV